MKKSVWPWILLAASAALAVVSYLLLPETVVTQFSAGGGPATTMPKLSALLIPFALGAGGALASAFGNGEEKRGRKGLLVSAVGLALFVLMLAVNL